MKKELLKNRSNSLEIKSIIDKIIYRRAENLRKSPKTQKRKNKEIRNEGMDKSHRGPIWEL